MKFLYVSCTTAYRWVTTNCYFISDILSQLFVLTYLLLSGRFSLFKKKKKPVGTTLAIINISGNKRYTCVDGEVCVCVFVFKQTGMS
jgi:hypothetical protein